MSISYVLVLFLLQLATGMAAAVVLIPPGIVDRRFFKSIFFFASLFTLLGLMLESHSTFRLSQAFVLPDNFSSLHLWKNRLYWGFGIFSFSLWFWTRFSERSIARSTLVMITLIGLGAVALDAQIYRPEGGAIGVKEFLTTLHFISSSLVLGGFLAGMIFGHWYLVNTEMPKRLLLTMAWVLIGALAFRIIAVLLTLLLSSENGHSMLGALSSFQGHGIFFWQRVLIGLVIPAGVVMMIWNTARIGSNQSATGIMYVGIAFIFIGELAAKYLFLMSGIPL